VRKCNRAGARPTRCRADEGGGSHEACANHAGTRTGEEAVRDCHNDEQRLTPFGRKPFGEAISNCHGDGDIPPREGNDVPKPRRREVCRETFVDAFTQADHDCRGKPAGGRGEHALNGITKGRPE
jgi:hypothetical protein